MANHPTTQDLQRLLVQVQESLEDVQRTLNDDTEPDTLLTREEAADRLRISTRTLDDMADTGEIQPLRIRGRVLYHPDTLEAYVRRRAGEGRSHG